VRILFLLSCLEPAGSETYCISLAEAWHGKHDIFWISDELFHGQPYKAMSIHSKAFPLGVVNTWRVASFIKENHIDLIHSHSRRAHWVGAQAAKLAKIPHITTIHQPLPVHFFSRRFPCLGDETIAIDEAIVDHLWRNFGRSRESIHLIRNGIDLAHAIPLARQTPNVRQILLIGRLSGGRWAAFQFFLEILERIAPTLPPACYKIVGQVPYEHRETLIRQLSMARSEITPSTIESLGYVRDLASLIRNSDAAICAGRSALECIAHGRPVIFMGEGGVLGLCKPDIWPMALRTNMGDHLVTKDFNAPRLESALHEILSPRAQQPELNLWARAQVVKEFDIRKIAPQVEAVYARALNL
jgi:glycosyltransferase involved in cell wall biosynthesis